MTTAATARAVRQLIELPAAAPLPYPWATLVAVDPAGALARARRAYRRSGTRRFPGFRRVRDVVLLSADVGDPLAGRMDLARNGARADVVARVYHAKVQRMLREVAALP